MIHWIAKQVRSDANAWPEYGEREKTRNEHLHELRAYQEYQCVYGEDAESALRFLLNANGHQGRSRVSVPRPAEDDLSGQRAGG